MEKHYFECFSRLLQLCVADFLLLHSVLSRRNFAFLEQVQQEFAKQNRFRRISSANAYGMDKAFAPNFRSALHYYNVNHNNLRQDEKVTKMMAQIEDMKNIMGRNVQMSMRRAGNLERMVQKSEDLEADVQVFYKKAKDVKRRKKQKYYRVYATLVAMVFFAIYLIVAAACGWKLECHEKITEV